MSWRCSSKSAAPECWRCKRRWPATCVPWWVRLWIVADVERCGDLAVNVVKAARRLLGTQLDDRLAGLVERMGR